MNTHPLVSVIIPTFNAERWIRETIESALAQTYPSIEIIVVDDCSQDGTLQILSTFGDRIRVIVNDSNQGVSISRNIAIEASRGEYIAFLDHDDLWHPQKLTKQMRLFETNPALGLVYSDCTYQTLTANHWNSFQINQPYRGNVFTKLIEHNFIPVLTAVIPRLVAARIGRFHPHFQCGEDYELFLRISERYPIDYIDEPLATYRVHESNFSHRIDTRYMEWVQILATYRARAGVNGSIAMVYVRWGRDLWRSEGQRGRGLLQLIKGLILSFRDPVGFFKAFKEAWQQKKNSRSGKKIHIPV